MLYIVISRQNIVRMTRLVAVEVAGRLPVLTGLQVHADSMKVAKTMINYFKS